VRVALAALVTILEEAAVRVAAEVVINTRRLVARVVLVAAAALVVRIPLQVAGVVGVRLVETLVGIAQQVRAGRVVQQFN
jgi:hypothetical protein